jgi:hypothetical protein
MSVTQAAFVFLAGAIAGVGILVGLIWYASLPNDQPTFERAGTVRLGLALAAFLAVLAFVAYVIAGLMPYSVVG